MTHGVADTALWSVLKGPGDLTVVESVPLAERGLPDSTYALLQRDNGSVG
ncbi:hypothetical protein [Rhodococcus tibetensis]|uniref:Uncharacterized protein n=1 Tax=Rhodococcus tibetensis TaxID=2965064 RepID=A0ABT1QFQ6_9NOCA|nr:hypothetical protein [Rhodococcus sp. FXJ9.536]MCQ4121037.1 hypothetical protein [Rhodococcus sp. FXJ9.536]